MNKITDTQSKIKSDTKIKGVAHYKIKGVGDT
jgi:hypothetical protein